jgi:hypothetical protein
LSKAGVKFGSLDPTWALSGAVEKSHPVKTARIPRMKDRVFMVMDSFKVAVQWSSCTGGKPTATQTTAVIYDDMGFDYLGGRNSGFA